MQIGLRPVQRCKGQVVAVSGWRLGMHLTQGRHSRVPGLGPQVSGTGVQVQVRVRENSGPEPVPEPELLNLAPEGRDPRPEIAFPPANHPVSGFPLS